VSRWQRGGAVRFAAAPLVVLLLVLGACSGRAEVDVPAIPASAAEPGPAPTPTSSPEFDAAVELLAYPETWCDGANRLVALGDAAALAPLVHAFGARAEQSRLCLLDAMEGLGAEAEAGRLAASDEAPDRHLAADLMELFPASSHLLALEQLVLDDDEDVRRQALTALAMQVQTEQWEALLIRLLGAERADVRGRAIRSLSRRRTETARDALQQHAARERDPELRRLLEP